MTESNSQETQAPKELSKGEQIAGYIIMAILAAATVGGLTMCSQMSFTKSPAEQARDQRFQLCADEQIARGEGAIKAGMLCADVK